MRKEKVEDTTPIALLFTPSCFKEENVRRVKKVFDDFVYTKKVNVEAYFTAPPYLVNLFQIIADLHKEELLSQAVYLLKEVEAACYAFLKAGQTGKRAEAQRVHIKALLETIRKKMTDPGTLPTWIPIQGSVLTAHMFTMLAPALKAKVCERSGNPVLTKGVVAVNIHPIATTDFRSVVQIAYYSSGIHEFEIWFASDDEIEKLTVGLEPNIVVKTKDLKMYGKKPVPKKQIAAKTATP